MRKYIPTSIKRGVRSIYNWMRPFLILPRIKLVQVRQKKALKRIRAKKKIKVAFFLIHDSMWNYEEIYRFLEQKDLYEPIIVICPNVWYGNDFMFHDMNKTYNTFISKGYNVKKAYNDFTKEWVDIKKEVHPDVVFFSNPHKCTKNDYYITNYTDCLTCYVPYGIMIANIQQLQYNQLFHNLLWKGFYETSVHKFMAEKYAINKGRNIVVTGFPLGDVYLNNNYKPNDVWKNRDRSLKRIIWAPHHSIEFNVKELAYSNFLNYHKFFLDLLERYSGKIQISFKPHPVLKPKLYQHPDWGIKKTDTYYDTWKNIENGQLEDSGYDDLFLTSDAMIMDSISFISEYCYTGKPSLFMVRDSTIISKFNEFGTIAFSLMYKSYSQNDIINFIDTVVINNEDTLAEKRKFFIDKYLSPPNNTTASTNILNYLLNEIHF